MAEFDYRVVGLFTLLLLLPFIPLVLCIEHRLSVTKTHHLKFRAPGPGRTHNLVNLALAFALGLAFACLFQPKVRL
jgi:hypothetical protein